MLTLKLPTGVVAAFCLLAAACAEPIVVSDADADGVSLGISVAAESDAADTDPETAIRSLRVYAYRGNTQVGFCHIPDAQTIRQNDVLRFRMDLAIASYSQPCDVVFYLVANESALYNSGNIPSGTDFFRERMSRGELDSYTFSGLNDGLSSPESLPMALRRTCTIDPGSIAGENVEVGHEGHFLLTQQLDFALTRCVGKLELYFARTSDAYSLEVHSATLTAAGRCDYGYLFAPTAAQQRAVPHTRTQPLRLFVSSGRSIGAIAAERTAYADYEPLALAAPCYLFENESGSLSPNIPGDERGYELQITYSTNRNGISTRSVFLPAVVRNSCCRVWCYIEYDGLLWVDYSVREWTDTAESEISFDYPQFDFMPYEEPSDPSFDPYATEVRYAADGESGVVRFRFVMTKGTAWIPSLEGYAQAFELKIYEADNPATEVVAPILPSERIYTIAVRATHGIETYAGSGLASDAPKAYLSIRSRMWNLQNYVSLDINRLGLWPSEDDHTKLDHITLTQGPNL